MVRVSVVFVLDVVRLVVICGSVGRYMLIVKGLMVERRFSIRVMWNNGLCIGMFVCLDYGIG